MSRPTGEYGAKAQAARILHNQGWPTNKIAAATAAREEDVLRWIQNPSYKPRPRRADHPCWSCGSTDRLLRKNGLCEPCTNARHDTIRDMLDHGLSHSRIAAAIGLTRGAVAAVAARRKQP